MDLRFREAGAGDVPALVALVNSAYRGEPSRAGWTTEADLLDGQRTDVATLAEEMMSGPVELVVAERALCDGELQAVGCFRLEPRGQGDGYLGMITVRPDLQGSGLGKALIAEAERLGRERGWASLEMTVIAQRDELLEFYRRRGYEPTGEREPFPVEDERFGVPKVDGLEFVVLRKQL